MELDIPCK
jgi:hypothetical protein